MLAALPKGPKACGTALGGGVGGCVHAPPSFQAARRGWDTVAVPQAFSKHAGFCLTVQ